MNPFNLLLLAVLFIVCSLLANYLMRIYGYPPPRSLKTREDKILFLMKLVLLSILSCISLAILLLFGLDPFNLLVNFAR
ncbi:MAG: hypothetical protein LAT67_14650 [Balneolales bacterium]|nr:hypothetical protein [Balneolales bacterium]